MVEIGTAQKLWEIPSGSLVVAAMMPVPTTRPGVAMAPATMAAATMVAAIMVVEAAVETKVETVAATAEMTAEICRTGMTKFRSSPVALSRGVHSTL